MLLLALDSIIIFNCTHSLVNNTDCNCYLLQDSYYLDSNNEEKLTEIRIIDSLNFVKPIVFF